MAEQGEEQDGHRDDGGVLRRHAHNDADGCGETGHQQHEEEHEEKGVTPVLVGAVVDEDGGSAFHLSTPPADRRTGPGWRPTQGE